MTMFNTPAKEYVYEKSIVELVKFDFGVSLELIKPYCGLVFCECNGGELSDERGYLYVCLRLVDQRMHQRGKVTEEISLQHEHWVDQVLQPSEFRESQARENYPIRLCESAARKLNLNLDIAAEDFRIWRATERVPLRATPDASEEFLLYDDSLPKVGVERVVADSLDLCQAKLAEQFPDRSPLLQELISPGYTFWSEGVGVDEQDARAAIDAKDADLVFVVLQDETVYPALKGILKNIGGADSNAVEEYLLGTDTNFLNMGRQMVQTFILLEDPELELRSVAITRIECVKEARGYLGGLIKFTPRFNVHWEQSWHIVRNYKKLQVIDYYLDLSQPADNLPWKAQVESSLNLVDQLNLSDILGRYGDEAGRVFEQIQSSLSGSQFIARLNEWGYKLKPSEDASVLGITYESSVGVVMVRIRRDNNKIDDVVYADRDMKVAIRLVAANGTISCTEM